jgi:hypothetical protein
MGIYLHDLLESTKKFHWDSERFFIQSYENHLFFDDLCSLYKSLIADTKKYPS